MSLLQTLDNEEFSSLKFIEEDLLDLDIIILLRVEFINIIMIK